MVAPTAWQERVLRLSFLFLLTGPTVIHLDTQTLPYPLATLAVGLYALTYCDLSEAHGGKSNLVVRRWRVWHWLMKYFDLSLVKTTELDIEQQYVFGIHPHSVLPFGAIIGMGINLDSLFPGLEYRVLAATFVFFVPFYREINLWGGIVDAARYSALRVLESGKSVALVPGGATEALYTDPNEDVVYLRKRRGFIKLALQHGAPLVPVFSFNEANTYKLLNTDNWPTIERIKAKFQSLTGLSLPLITNIIPRKTKITIVVGTPIPTPHLIDPSPAQVSEYLNKYIQGLEDLYAEYGPIYNEPQDKPPLRVL